ncbi:MAG: cadherin-like domain-containing protein [Gemmatales bacterium]|nr:cadherin-like domain-containing protein [Gemmatales bacterium]
MCIPHEGGDGPYYFGHPISLPSGGSLTVFADGTFTYAPPPNYAGPDSFTFTLSDGLDSTSAEVNIFLYNSAPVASDAYYTILHDTELTGQVYDYDADGESIVAELVSGPANGTLILNPDGSFIYTPNQWFTGLDTFVYRWRDGVTASLPATVTILMYDNLWFQAEADDLHISISQLTEHLPIIPGSTWPVSLISQPRWGSVSWASRSVIRYEFDTSLYNKLLNAWQNESPIGIADGFSVSLTHSETGLTFVRDTKIGLHPMISRLNSISPPTQGDGSGQPVHSWANRNFDLIARLRDHDMTVET